MSGGSVFGMTSDFHFEQSPYNDAALNSVENRQNGNTPKSMDPVRRQIPPKPADFFRKSLILA